jgi:predicted histidine transporter YuiF (NhaC family)
MIESIKKWSIIIGSVVIGVMGLIIAILINSNRKKEYEAMIVNDETKRGKLKQTREQIVELEKELKDTPDESKEETLQWLKDQYSEL